MIYSAVSHVGLAMGSEMTSLCSPILHRALGAVGVVMLWLGDPGDPDTRMALQGLPAQNRLQESFYQYAHSSEAIGEVRPHECRTV
jgi:hypothetical protein